MAQGEDDGKVRTHVVPESFLIKEEDEDPEADLDMVVDMDEVEKREQMNFKEEEDMDLKQDFVDDEMDGYDGQEWNH